MRKKGQIALFILLGIVLLIGISFFLYFNMKQSKMTPAGFSENVPTELSSVKTFVDDCLKETAMHGVSILGQHGGYIYERDPSLAIEYATMAYGLYGGENVLPTLKEMEKELGSFISQALPECIANFSSFSAQDLSGGSISAKAQIDPAKVTLYLEFPVTLRTGARESQISKFYYEFPVRLWNAVGVSNKIIQNFISDPLTIDMTFLSSFDVNVNAVPHDSKNLIISITDEKSMLFGEPFLFTFANEMQTNSPPKLIASDKYILKDDFEFSTVLKVEDEDDTEFEFWDNTQMFEIDDSTGRIKFTPRITGTFNVRIRVTDPHGAWDEKTIEFLVER